MKRKWMSLLLAVILVIQILPVSVLATAAMEAASASMQPEEMAIDMEYTSAFYAEDIPDAVAQVTMNGKTGTYDDIYDAFSQVAFAEAEDEAVLRLLEDWFDDWSEPIIVDSGTFTLDLNGYVLAGNQYTLSIEGDADVTLVDSSAAQTGIVKANVSAVRVYDESTLTIEGGTFEVSKSQNSVIAVYGGMLHIRGGEMVKRFEDDPDILQYGGTVSFEGHPDPEGIVLWTEIESEEEPFPISTYALPEGYCFYYMEQLEGGMGTDSEPLALIYPADEVVIGRVPAEPAAQVTIGGKTAEYTTMRQAIAALADAEAEDKAVLRPVKDIMLGDPLMITSGTFTFDLHGYVLSGGHIALEEDADVTLIDSSDEQTGGMVNRGRLISIYDEAVLTIEGGSYETNIDHRFYLTNGTLNIRGGTFVEDEDGEIIIDVRQLGGAISFAGHPAPEGIIVHKAKGSTVPASAYSLPDGYAFYEIDWNDKTVETVPADGLERVSYYIVGSLSTPPALAAPVMETTVNGKAEKHMTVEAAMKAIQRKDGEITLRLLADVEVDEIYLGGVSAETSIYTLDLNGYTLELMEEYVSVMHGTLIIEDSSDTLGAIDKFAAYVDDTAALIINGGTFTGYDSGFVTVEGKAEINGGTFCRNIFECYGQKASLTLSGNAVLDDRENCAYHVDWAAGRLILIDDPTGITVSNGTGANQSWNKISLPEGYCFYTYTDGVIGTEPVAMLEDGKTYVVGEGELSVQCTITEGRAVITGDVLSYYLDETNAMLMMAAYDSEGRYLGMTDGISRYGDGPYEMIVEAEGIAETSLFIMEGSYTPLLEAYVFE